jgi:hypothetical protein
MYTIKSWLRERADVSAIENVARRSIDGLPAGLSAGRVWLAPEGVRQAGVAEAAVQAHSHGALLLPDQQADEQPALLHLRHRHEEVVLWRGGERRGRGEGVLK